MRRRGASATLFSLTVAVVLGVAFSPAATARPPLRPEAISPTSAAGFKFVPDADAYVSAAKPKANYGGTTRLKADSTPTTDTYLRFAGGNLTGQVTRATLWLYAVTGSDAGYTIHAVSDATWKESSITYANAPVISPSPVGSAPAYSSGAWTTVDVTSIVTATGSANLALTTSAANALSLASRESGTKSPVLVIETTVPDVTAPSAPTNLLATATTGSSVSLSWSAATDNVGVAGYGVYRNGTLVASTSQTTDTLSALACETTYTLGVDAHDAAGNRSAQTPLVVTTGACPDTTAPSDPSGLTITSASATAISLSWTPSTDNVAITGYNLFLNGTKVASTSATKYSFDGLSCGTSYSLGVQAYDAAGNRSAQNSIVAATSPCLDTSPPTAPTGLLVTAASSTTISTLWSPSFDNVGVTGYDVFLSGSKIASISLTSYTFGGLTCGTSYTLGVEAHDAACDGGRLDRRLCGSTAALDGRPSDRGRRRHLQFSHKLRTNGQPA